LETACHSQIRYTNQNKLWNKDYAVGDTVGLRYIRETAQTPMPRFSHARFYPLTPPSPRHSICIVLLGYWRHATLQLTSLTCIMFIFRHFNKQICRCSLRQQLSRLAETMEGGQPHQVDLCAHAREAV
jgi:hypothetical protein